MGKGPYTMFNIIRRICSFCKILVKSNCNFIKLLVKIGMVTLLCKFISIFITALFEQKKYI